MPQLGKIFFTTLGLSLATLFAAAGIPGTAAECKEGASDEKALSACTAYIDSAQYQGKELAVGFYRRAIAHGNFAETPQAQADINKAIELDPENGQYYFVRANIQWATGSAERDEKAALADYDKAIALMPTSSLYFGNRCYALSALRKPQPEKAKADCRRAMELDPDNQGAAALLDQLEQKP